MDKQSLTIANSEAINDAEYSELFRNFMDKIKNENYILTIEYSKYN
ncbi:hypothetical protein AB9T89_20990 [Flavobacterium oncorhynchi]